MIPIFRRKDKAEFFSRLEKRRPWASEELRANVRLILGLVRKGGDRALLKLARVQAALDGRAYVIPDDVKAFVRSALIHRLILTPDLWMQRRAADSVLDEVTRSVDVPVRLDRR